MGGSREEREEHWVMTCRMIRLFSLFLSSSAQWSSGLQAGFGPLVLLTQTIATHFALEGTLYIVILLLL